MNYGVFLLYFVCLFGGFCVFFFLFVRGPFSVDVKLKFELCFLGKKVLCNLL